GPGARRAPRRRRPRRRSPARLARRASGSRRRRPPTARRRGRAPRRAGAAGPQASAGRRPTRPATGSYRSCRASRETGSHVGIGLAAHAPERLDLAPDLRLLAARSLYDLLAPQLGLPHVELRLAPGRGLHLVAEPLRRHERVLEGPLALGEPPRALLERGELLPEQRVLLQHGLVVVRDVVEERVHFVLVEAAE